LDAQTDVVARAEERRRHPEEHRRSEGRFACLKSGECAAASLDQPSIFMGLDAGFHALGISNEIGPRLYQVDIVNPAWATAHRDAVIKYIRGTNAAMRFIQDPKNRDEVLKVTMAFMKESEAHSRQMLATIWEPKNHVFDGSAPDMNAVKAAISLMGEYDALRSRCRCRSASSTTATQGIGRPVRIELALAKGVPCCVGRLRER
jgi:hypothetical protein